MTNPLALGLAPLPIPSALRRQLHSLRQGQRLRARPLAGFALLMASISIALSACSSQAATGKAVIVQVLDASSAYPQGRFSPDKIVVNPGAKVIWVMDTGAVDSVTADSGKWGSGLLHHGQRYAVRFNQPGTYRYHDVVHFITGEVVVR